MNELIKLKSFPIETLKILLKDKTTQKNIIWATSSYEEYGADYFAEKQMTDISLIGLDSIALQPRILKALEHQKERTRNHAEVFTPAWICDKMINYFDDEWNKTWQQYVDLKVLEITCGEAPYLVSRYDASTGEIIDIQNRIGILDRKIRIVNENTDNEDDWFKWTIRAFQSVYGYEYQGDNLLIARINVLMTFIDYLAFKYNRQPTILELNKIANIISWNIWQMDGLTGTVPLGEPEEEICQMSLFEDLQSEKTTPKSKIYNWRSSKSVTFKGENCMKFDFVIGNPPYNKEAQKTSTSDDPIYNLFMDASYEISDKSMLITPARFLMNAGKTPTKWNYKMLNDTHLKVLYYEEDSQKIFPSASIPGGIVVTYRNANENYGAIKQFINYKELQSIDKKVQAYDEKTLDLIIYSQNKYNLDNLYADFPEMKAEIGSDGKDKRFRQNSMEKFNNIFKISSEKDDIRVLGLISRERSYRYINKKYVEYDEWIDMYKVFVPFSNGASGTLGAKPARLISKPVLGFPGDGITQTFIGIGKFKNENEARNLLKYIYTKFARVLLGILKVTQGNKAETWSHVPIQDFTDKSDIDWTLSVKEIDKQLYKKYNLSDEEIEFIEEKVKEME